WQPYPIQTGRREFVWRTHQFLGVQRAEQMRLAGPQPASAIPDCLVIDVANLGFRDQPDAWPAVLHDPAAIVPHIIVKLSNPLAAGPLWERLSDSFADALTVYCSADDLRKEYAPIGQ